MNVTQRWIQVRVIGAIVIALTALNWANCWMPLQGDITSRLQTKLLSQNSSAEDQIRSIIEEYANSINAADPVLASRIWLDSPEVSFIHPLGHEHGFAQIKENIYRHLMGDTFSQRKLSIHDISIKTHVDSAWAEFYWDFSAKFRRDNSPITTHGRETQVYWKMGDGWRLVHVHYSSLPVNELRKGF